MSLTTLNKAVNHLNQIKKVLTEQKDVAQKLGKGAALIIAVDKQAPQQRIPDSEFQNISLLVVPSIDPGVFRGVNVLGFFSETPVDDRVLKALKVAQATAAQAGVPVVLENG